MPRNDVSNRYITKICAVGQGCNLAFGSRSPGVRVGLRRHSCPCLTLAGCWPGAIGAGFQAAALRRDASRRGHECVVVCR